MKINVVLVDDHSMILEGLSSLLSKEPDFCVIAKLSNQEEIESFINQFKNQQNKTEETVAIVDLSFNDDAIIKFSAEEQENEPFGFSIVQEFSKLSIKSIIYSMHSTPDCVRFALSEEVGAKGYVLKTSENSNIINAIKTASSGGIYIQKELYPFLNVKKTNIELFLTGKEKEIARLIVKNLPNEAIAAALKISKRTVQNHISHIYDKTGCDNRFSCIEFLKENL